MITYILGPDCTSRTRRTVKGHWSCCWSCCHFRSGCSARTPRCRRLRSSSDCRWSGCWSATSCHRLAFWLPSNGWPAGWTGWAGWWAGRASSERWSRLVRSSRSLSNWAMSCSHWSRADRLDWIWLGYYLFSISSGSNGRNDPHWSHCSASRSSSRSANRFVQRIDRSVVACAAESDSHNSASGTRRHWVPF